MKPPRALRFILILSLVLVAWPLQPAAAEEIGLVDEVILDDNPFFGYYNTAALFENGQYVLYLQGFPDPPGTGIDCTINHDTLYSLKSTSPTGPFQGPVNISPTCSDPATSYCPPGVKNIWGVGSVYPWDSQMNLMAVNHACGTDFEQNRFYYFWVKDGNRLSEPQKFADTSNLPDIGIVDPVPFKISDHQVGFFFKWNFKQGYMYHDLKAGKTWVLLADGTYAESDENWQFDSSNFKNITWGFVNQVDTAGRAYAMRIHAAAPEDQAIVRRGFTATPAWQGWGAIEDAFHIPDLVGCTPDPGIGGMLPSVVDSTHFYWNQEIDCSADFTAQLILNYATVPGPPVGQQPFHGQPFAVSNTGFTTIQVEDFDFGGPQVAYYDTTAQNLGTSSYRTDIVPGSQVDLFNQSGSTSGPVVGYTVAGEWLEYSLDIGAADVYNVSLKLATVAQRSVSMEFRNSGGTLIDALTAVPVPDTGSYQSYETVDLGDVTLPAGPLVLRLYEDSGDYNLDEIVISPAPQPSTVIIAADTFNGGVNRPLDGETTETGNLTWIADSNSLARILNEAGGGNGFVSIHDDTATRDASGTVAFSALPTDDVVRIEARLSPYRSAWTGIGLLKAPRGVWGGQSGKGLLWVLLNPDFDRWALKGSADLTLASGDLTVDVSSPFSYRRVRIEYDVSSGTADLYIANAPVATNVPVQNPNFMNELSHAGIYIKRGVRWSTRADGFELSIDR